MKMHKTHIPAGDPNLSMQDHIKTTHKQKSVKSLFQPSSMTCKYKHKHTQRSHSHYLTTVRKGLACNRANPPLRMSVLCIG